MKLNKLWKKTEGETVGIHSCKKCGCELASTNKDILCDNCRREIAEIAKNVGLGILSFAALGVGVLIKAWADSTNQKS